MKLSNMDKMDIKKQYPVLIMLVISGIGVLLMTGVILYAFIDGNFSEEGSQILSMPWGIVSMVDLYVGFTLFACWAFYREKIWLACIWTILFMCLGNFATSLYVFVNLFFTKGDPLAFFLGNEKKNRKVSSFDNENNN